jgi:5-methylcytosine-specific restriction endonuclease McrA
MSNWLPDDFYGNALIISQTGKPLCTLNRKRIEWYLKRGLAEEVPPPEGYPRAIQLNFKAKLDIRNPKPYELAILKSQCVLCGSTDKLTIHHVVPQCIRKLFPVSEKARARQWCVLLCVKCHKNVEDVTQAVYRKDYPKSGAPILERDQILLRRLKGMGILHKLDPEKLTRLLSSAGYQSISDIPGPPTPEENHSLPKLASKLHRQLLTQWGHDFISSHGGIEGTKSYFRELFLDFKPKYLPVGYLDF